MQSEFYRFACQGFERPLFELIIVLFLADVGVVDAALQHPVDQEGQFVCRGDDSLRFSDAGTKTATKSAKYAPQLLLLPRRRIVETIRNTLLFH